MRNGNAALVRIHNIMIWTIAQSHLARAFDFGCERQRFSAIFICFVAGGCGIRIIVSHTFRWARAVQRRGSLPSMRRSQQPANQGYSTIHTKVRHECEWHVNNALFHSTSLCVTL